MLYLRADQHWWQSLTSSRPSCTVRGIGRVACGNGSRFSWRLRGGGFPVPAHALSLYPDSQIAVTRSSAAPELYTVWARLADGRLASRREVQPPDGFIWVDHGYAPPGNVTVSTRGVAATWWTVGAVYHQRAAFVGSDGSLWQRVVQNGTAVGWLGYSPPTGKTLTGHVAMSWAFDGQGVRKVLVGVTTTDGGFHVLTYDPNDSLKGTWALRQSSVSAIRPIAASNSADGTYARFFMVNNAAGNQNQVWLERANAGNWLGYDLGAPNNDSTPVCGTMAAAEGVTGASTYATYLFCTTSGASDHFVYAAYGDQINEGAGYTWLSKGLEGAEVARNTGYALAATRRPDSSYNAIDAYVINTQTPDSKIYRVRHPAGGSLGDAAPLLADLDTTQRVGGMAAAPTNYGFSMVYFAGKVGNATRLYRGVGDPAQSGSTSWRAHQSASPRSTPFPFASPGHAEGVIASHRGRAAATGIVRPGPGSQDWPWVEVAWSTDDGDTWNAPAKVPQTGGGLGALQLEFVSDPTVDFTDIDSGHRAYVAVNGFRSPDNDCTSTWSDGAVYLVNTTNGTLSSPELVRLDDDVDHPWIGIQRVYGGADRIHVVWKEISSVLYRTRLVGGAWEPVRTLTDAGAPPSLTIGSGSNVFVMWAGEICHINANRDGCDRLEGLTSILVPNGGTAAPDPPALERIPIPPGEEFLRLGPGYSLKASRLTNALYYAFNAKEGVGDLQSDVYFARITYDAVANDFTFHSRVQVTDGSAYVDDRDQFSPAVVVSHDTESGTPIIGVSWYDRRQGDGDCEGEVNRCFVARRSVSIDGGLTFFDTQTIPASSLVLASDPAHLPYHCAVPDLRFHGDYHESAEETLHAWHYVVAASDADPVRSALVSSWFSGGYYHYAGTGP